MAAIIVAVALLLASPAGAAAESVELSAAQTLFYSGRYADAAAASGALCTPDVTGLAACELQTSAILFQLRRALGDAPDREDALAKCQTCPELLSSFSAAITSAQAIGRAHVKAHPDDVGPLFLLGKIDLNFVWLQLGTLGRKTGWDEYWEARHSLDKVLKLEPGNLRAKVSRAWIDYIVDTKMPRGTRWLLGGGSKKKGLQAVREAAAATGDPFVRAEAGFALWDMQVREKNFAEAVVTASRLARDFPTNPELQKFLAAHPLD